MIHEAIKKIEEMSRAFIYPEIDSRTYSSKPIHAVLDPSPTALRIATLTGMVDYIKTNVDGLSPSGLIIHVASFQLVNLLAGLNKKWANRNQFIRIECDTLKFPFGSFMDVESFIIRMQSQFVPSPEADAILKIVGNVSDAVVKQFSDDGVTQQATVKAGVSRVENVAVPNPVTLVPYRTFLEIEQPASKFVFRMRSGNEAPTCALFESDGGNWKNEAILKIKAWLAEKIPDVAIIA